MANKKNPILAEKKNPILSEYVKLLGWSTCLLMILTVLAGVVASVRYGENAAGIEGIWHRELSPAWTIALLWLPLIIQLLVLMCLSARVWRDKANQTMRHYFKFYFIRTFISTFAYVTLWLIYTFVMQSHDRPSGVQKGYSPWAISKTGMPVFANGWGPRLPDKRISLFRQTLLKPPSARF